MTQDTPIPQVGGSSFQITPGLTPELAKTYHVTQWKPTAEAAAEGRAYTDLGIFTGREMRALHHAIEHALGTPGTQDWAQGPYALPGVTPDFKPKGDWIDNLVDDMDGDGSIDRFTVSRSTVRDTILRAIEISRAQWESERAFEPASGWVSPGEAIVEALRDEEPVTFTYWLSPRKLNEGEIILGIPAERSSLIAQALAGGAVQREPSLSLDERNWITLGRPGEVKVTIEAVA